MSNPHAEKPEEIPVHVNGRPKKWSEPTISYEQLVQLAFPDLPPDPNRYFTATYKRGNDEGTLAAGSPPVVVKPGMIFNVTPTDRS